MNDYDKYTHLMPSYVVAQNEKKARRTAIMFNITGSVIGGACIYYSIIVWLGQIMGKFKAPIHFGEDIIAEYREALSSEITDSLRVTISGKTVHIHELLEDADHEDMANVISMLLVDAEDAYKHASDVLKCRFDALFDDADIEAHIINEIEEDAAERHSQEVDEREYCYGH